MPPPTYPPFTVRAVRSGACLGAAVHRAKALQIQLAHGNPGESADEAGKVAGFGLSFNIEPSQNDDDRLPGAATRRPHPYNGATDGPRVRLAMASTAARSTAASIRAPSYRE
ncbi:unnamed protein product [Laminaria digitata]